MKDDQQTKSVRVEGSMFGIIDIMCFGPFLDLDKQVREVKSSRITSFAIFSFHVPSLIR